MILGFKTHIKGNPTGFVEKIKAGTKIHTLRECAVDRWRSGAEIQFATGVRTKNYEQFFSGKCTGVQEVYMGLHNNSATSKIFVAIMEYPQADAYTGMKGRLKLRPLEGKPLDDFIRNDGFDNSDDFCNWFRPVIAKDPILEKRFVLIHWTDLRY